MSVRSVVWVGVVGGILAPLLLQAGVVASPPRVTVVESDAPVRLEEVQPRADGSLDLYLRNTSADTAVAVGVQGMVIGSGGRGGFGQRIAVSLPPGVADMYSVRIEKTLKLAPAELFVSMREVVLVDRSAGQSLWKAGHLEADLEGRGYNLSSQGFMYTHRQVGPAPELPGQSCCNQCEDIALGCGLAMVRGQCRPHPCVLSMECGGEDPRCQCSFVCKDPSQCC